VLFVHHLGVSQSERVVWLCEELSIPYKLVRYEREPTRLAPPAYKALHPMGSAPVIEDNGVVLAESGAIVDYVIARYGGGRLAVKPEAPNYPDFLYWSQFANATLMSSIAAESIAARAGMQFPPAASRCQRAFAMIEQRLGEAPYFAGNAFTAADIMMVFPLTTMRAFAPRDYTDSPNLLAYLARIGARPAYRAAMTKGDPGMAPMLGATA
jgi:glutathione S-transferase